VSPALTFGALGAALLPIAAAAALKIAVAQSALPPLEPETGRLALDRNGTLLRPFPVADGRWRLPIAPEAVDPLFIRTLIAYEDRRFYEHRGVDTIALGRAAWQFIRHSRPVSGASTLTMQVARLAAGQSTRSAGAKLRQIISALALERRLTKAEILSLYLKLAPYGGNVEGVRAAALAYLGKEPRRLNPAEAALLVALPQAPEARRPDRHASAARRARDRVLDRVAGAGVLTAEDVAAARREPVAAARQAFPMLAPHLTARAVAAAPDRATHRLTLDAGLQSRLQALAAERARSFADPVSVAILATDHTTGDILASVGSSDLFDARRGGFVDMTQAVRSPGSTLKPLIYGLAFESGVAHPETLIEDRPIDFAGYAPENFDRIFHGTVNVRRALQLSLNVPRSSCLRRSGRRGSWRACGVAVCAPSSPMSRRPAWRSGSAA